MMAIAKLVIEKYLQERNPRTFPGIKCRRPRSRKEVDSTAVIMETDRRGFEPAPQMPELADEARFVDTLGSFNATIMAAIDKALKISIALT
jgi:hypothetical protein